MMTSIEERNERPLRILTIDNGGLQAISILRMLKDVCDALSKAEDSGWKAPHELFDIIAGIGTGGWLAILLGRYKLDIDQCMGVYMSVANALNPHEKQSKLISNTGGPAAISQDILIDKIDKIIAEHGLGEYMVGGEEARSADASRTCYAFAVGMVERTPGQTKQDYHLFRTYRIYNPPLLEVSSHPDPCPDTCKVSKACAATGAAKDFLQSCEVDGVRYWDDTFPNTHNVSFLALDEAITLFGKGRQVAFVLNLSPGIASAKQIGELRKAARNNTTRTSRIAQHMKRAISFGSSRKAVREQCDVPSRRRTDPQEYLRFALPRADTATSTSSTSSAASEKEKGYQKVIKERVQNEYGDGDKYYRLEMIDGKPYLNDIEDAKQSMDLADNFLGLPTTQNDIQEIVRRCTEPHKGGRCNILYAETITASPATSVRSQHSASSFMTGFGMSGAHVHEQLSDVGASRQPIHG